jgi:acyl-coenzyme A thioesterase PaaI-like protein
MGRAVHNIIGTIHAGALFTLAETAAGVAAFGAAPGDGAMVLLRAAKVRYTRRAEGDLVATAWAPPELAQAAGADFEADGRADLVIEVAIIDDHGEPVFEGSFDYALRARKS